MAFRRHGKERCQAGYDHDTEARVRISPLQYGMGDAQRPFVVQRHDAHDFLALPPQESAFIVYSGNVEQHVETQAQSVNFRIRASTPGAVGQVA